ncbi:MAG: hypothetical protein M3Z06_08420 [Actinomycetota bacterium]|nr:hypothetical protein [Actinomycetota bacterium]
MANAITFDIERRVDDLGQLEFVPVVDGVNLTDRIHSFEREAGMETRERSYGGLIPAFFRFGPALDHYLAGTAAAGEGRIVLLGCGDCGEWGCWPLTAELVVAGETVTWQGFLQPHRPDRDYSGFGPFVFERSEYARAVAAVAAAWHEASSTEPTPE